MRMYRWFAIAAIAVVAACSNSSTGYGGNPPPPPPPPPGGHSTTITVGNNSTNSFSPTPDTIPAGNITFHWAAAAVTHNVTWDSGPTTPANSGNRAGGDADFVAALTAGTYAYHCTIHGATMSGSIIVTP